MTNPEKLHGNTTLYCGDCLEQIKSIPDNSIDSVVTDPPYALVSITKRFGKDGSAPAKSDGPTGVYQRASSGFMNLNWDTGETAFAIEIWQECLRVLKPGGHLIAFGGTRTYHRLACAIEDAGFEIRDQIQWIFGTGFPKSHNVSLSIDKQSGTVNHLSKSFNMKGGGDRSSEFTENGRDFSIKHTPKSDKAKEWDGWGTALKPANEPICLARKPLSENTIAANVLRWRTGAINIDACRVQSETRPHVVSNRRSRNNTYGDDLCGSVANGTMDTGRWPANVCHDGSAEVVSAFPEGSKSGHHAKKSTGFGERKYLGAGHASGDSGSAARFFYSAKANKTDRAGSKHPTVKPVDLMQYLVRLVTPPGGTVMDCFAGTGTTAEAAFKEGFSSIMIEREEEYQEDIRRRMELTTSNKSEEKPKEENQGSLFEDNSCQ